MQFTIHFIYNALNWYPLLLKQFASRPDFYFFFLAAQFLLDSFFFWKKREKKSQIRGNKRELEKWCSFNFLIAWIWSQPDKAVRLKCWCFYCLWVFLCVFVCCFDSSQEYGSRQSTTKEEYDGEMKKNITVKGSMNVCTVYTYITHPPITLKIFVYKKAHTQTAVIILIAHST